MTLEDLAKQTPDGEHLLLKRMGDEYVLAQANDGDEITLHGKLYVLKAKT